MSRPAASSDPSMDEILASIRKIIAEEPAAKSMLRENGSIITLIKPHYEADPALLRKGVLPLEHLDAVMRGVEATIDESSLRLISKVQSPITGATGNVEILALLQPKP